MKKIIIASLCLIVISACAPQHPEEKQEISIGNQNYICEIANTPSKRQQGLMYREKLANNECMLFKFPKEGDHSFWMKNTLLSLDIIWIDQNKNVVDFITAHPCLDSPCPIYRSEKNAKYVVEVLANSFTGKVGDKFEFTN